LNILKFDPFIKKAGSFLVAKLSISVSQVRNDETERYKFMFYEFASVLMVRGAFLTEHIPLGRACEQISLAR
jgi:hypothetical protein